MGIAMVSREKRVNLCIARGCFGAIISIKIGNKFIETVISGHGGILSDGKSERVRLHTLDFQIVVKLNCRVKWKLVMLRYDQKCL